MTRERANKVYDVLVEVCEAIEYERTGFVNDMTSAYPAREWRFRGKLGYGGKYWPSANDVNCYSEDETPERLAIIEIANARLR